MKLENKFKIYIILLLIVVAGGVVLLFNGPTYAKYVSNSILNYNLKSKGFYLSSDFLGTVEISNVNNLWDGQSVHFNVKNNLNNSLITDYIINYTASCVIEGEGASYMECRMNGGESNTYTGALQNVGVCKDISNGLVKEDLTTKEECETSLYKWVNVPVITDLYFDVVLTNENYSINDVVVNLTLNSTSPYYKSLIGKFILQKVNMDETQVNMKFNAYSNYNNLVVSNTSISNKCLKISWDSSKLLIDTNSDYKFDTVDGEGYVNSITFNVEAKKLKTFKFYNRNLTETYNTDVFLLENASGC